MNKEAPGKQGPLVVLGPHSHGFLMQRKLTPHFYFYTVPTWLLPVKVAF